MQEIDREVRQFKNLLVIINDRLSDLIKKGEITDRYYNPQNLFQNVHLLLINDDKPSAPELKRMVGSAQLHIHNLPPPSFKTTLGWHPVFLSEWSRAGIKLAKEIRPDLIRCHGAHLNSFLAAQIKRELGTPFVISMHINPDQDIRRLAKRYGVSLKERFRLHLQKKLERRSISSSDATVCVYRFIEPYAHRMRAPRVEVIYNSVNPSNLVKKDDYSASDHFRIIVPGRQIPQKDPTPVLNALLDHPKARLTLVGDGSLHKQLQAKAQELGVQDRCEFIPAMDNDRLCRTLKDYDLLISVNEYGGISKVELEASFIGMPLITNNHPLEDEPEILGKNCLVVEGSAESYSQSIGRLINNQQLRQKLGSSLRKSVEAIRPEVTEKKIADLYKEILAKE